MGCVVYRLVCCVLMCCSRLLGRRSVPSGSLLSLDAGRAPSRDRVLCGIMPWRTLGRLCTTTDAATLQRCNAATLHRACVCVCVCVFVYVQACPPVFG
jgi:hypothetical protein